MPGLLKAGLTLGFLWLLGAAVLEALGLRQRRWPLWYAQPGIDFAIGAATLAAIWVCAAPFGCQVLPWAPAIVAAAAAAAALLQRRRRRSRHAQHQAGSPPREQRRWVTAFFVFVLAAAVFGVGAQAYRSPMFGDGRYIWAFKAKVMFSDGRLDRGTFTDLARYRHTALDHPLALPATEALLYYVLGYIDERVAKLIGVIYLAGIGAVLASYLRRRMAWPWALAVSIVVCPVPMLAFYAGAGGADVPLAFHFLAAGVLLADYAEAGRAEDGIMSALLFGTGGTVKSEGLTMAVAGAFALAILWRLRRGTAAQALAGVGALVLSVLPWVALRAAWGVPSAMIEGMHVRGFWQLYVRMDAIGQAVWERFTTWESWEAAWLAVLAGLLVWALARGRPRRLGYLWALLAWQLAVDVSVYLMNPYEIHWTLAASLDRLLLQLMPLGMVAAASAIAAAVATRPPGAQGLRDVSFDKSEAREPSVCRSSST